MKTILIIVLLCFWSTSIAQQNDIIKKYTIFGDNLIKKERYQEAIEMYTNAINLNPQREKLSYLYSARGYAYLLNDNDSLAIKDYQNSIIIDSKNTYSHLSLLSIYIDNVNYNKVVQTGGFMITCLGEDYQIRTQIGLAYHFMNDYNKAIELEQDYYEAISNRGIVYAQMNQFENQ